MSRVLDYIINTPAWGPRSPTKRRPRNERRWDQKAITCRDGTSISVQASYFHRCTPRNNRGPWTHVEVGYPSATPPDSWKDYQEGDDGIYNYIPVELVREFIALHGGEA